jgi:hypothetical protein
LGVEGKVLGEDEALAVKKVNRSRTLKVEKRKVEIFRYSDKVLEIYITFNEFEQGILRIRVGYSDLEHKSYF